MFTDTLMTQKYLSTETDKDPAPGSRDGLLHRYRPTRSPDRFSHLVYGSISLHSPPSLYLSKGRSRPYTLTFDLLSFKSAS